MRYLAALGLLVAGCDLQPTSATSEDRATAPIVGGTVDTVDSAVVAIVPRRSRCDELAPTPACTGTLIGPRVVLTAAHCLFPSDGPGTLEVYAGATVGDDAGAYLAVADVAIDPAFDRATHAHDLAVLRLAADAPVAPVALPSAQLDAAALPATARVVGFGVTAVGTIADGQRRQTTMTVSVVGAATFDATPAPGNSCGGDSGGPVFVTIGGAEQLVGVTSAGDATCMTRATNARVDIALDAFVRPALASPAPAEGAIAIAALCGATCTSAADCPAAMGCGLDPDGSMRCQIAPDPAMHYGQACSAASQCGGAGACARIGNDDCRCAVACGDVEVGGCETGGGGGTWAATLLILAVCRLGCGACGTLRVWWASSRR